MDRVDALVDGCERACIESLPFARKTGKYVERAHLFYALIDRLTVRGLRVETATPSELKRFATGRGTASKSDVITRCVSNSVT
ncbi:hypothetical protein, partial [Pseudonocardia sp. ICBG1142]|uniref:hypothetical protein n=1 Tax=Pseudonocardia sp. ICBG1142 TaxID=2846760 RepID=UPI001CF6F2F7